MSPLSAAETLLHDMVGVRTRLDKALDVGTCVLAAALGMLFLIPILGDPTAPLSQTQAILDLTGAAAACLLLWWRRRSPVLVAVLCLLLGTFSISATAPGLFALFSLAVHRPTRPALFVAALWIPSSLAFGLYSSTTDPVSVVLLVTSLALAAVAGGMFLRGRRLLLLTLRERAQRAEADQRLHEDRARMAERTRIAREMHDVLAHRISLLACTPERSRSDPTCRRPRCARPPGYCGRRPARRWRSCAQLSASCAKSPGKVRCLQERVALAGGTLVHGPDSTGDFVVEADLKW